MVNSPFSSSASKTSFFSMLENEDRPSQPSLLLVVKWGGQLTQTGRTQAEALGRV